MRPQTHLAFKEKDTFAWSFNYPNPGLLEGTVHWFSSDVCKEFNQKAKNGKTSSAGSLYFINSTSSPLFRRKVYRPPVILIRITTSQKNGESLGGKLVCHASGHPC